MVQPMINDKLYICGMMTGELFGDDAGHKIRGRGVCAVGKEWIIPR